VSRPANWPTLATQLEEQSRPDLDPLDAVPQAAVNIIELPEDHQRRL
jgi:hypothetical protein